MENNNKNKDFLQSTEWQKFQEKAGRKIFTFQSADFSAKLIEHTLPIVGKYVYVPRGPILEIQNPKSKIQNQLTELVSLAKKENAGWIRIEPENMESLELIKENISENVVKAPHDTQPKEIFVIDITKSQQELLAEMKSKTRYNIGIAQKKGVKILSCNKNDLLCMSGQLAFLQLTKEMATRQGIVSHAEAYYRKMIESLPAEMLKIYVAEYEGKIIAANLVLFYGNTATYLHGASSNENRNVMAPFFLQWQTILDAKEKGFAKYDFGGVKTANNLEQSTNNWEGITHFKMGFSPSTAPIVFPGSYDIIINSRKYAVYRGLQRAKALLRRMQK